MYRRIIVIGPCGSGKSTFSKRLARETGLPLVHLDALYWLPGWKERDKAEFDALLLEELKKDRWIIDGNYGRTIPLRLQYCDTVIWLDFNRVTCVLGVLRRVLKGRGKTRDDMGALCPERFDWDFIKYTWNFNRSNREKYRRMLAGVPGVSIYVVRSRRALRRIESELICHQEATQP